MMTSAVNASERNQTKVTARPLLRQKAVAASANGFNQSIVAAGRQCKPQAPDMHVNCSFLNIHVVPPDPVKKHGAGQYAVRVSHQKMQQSEFGGTQIDWLTV